MSILNSTLLTKRNCIGTSNAKNGDLYYVFLTMDILPQYSSKPQATLRDRSRVRC